MKLYNKNTFETTIVKARKVYCSNDLTYGLKLLPAKNALNYNYIQINNKRVIAFLVIDLDHTNSFIFEKCKLPAPNFIVRTKEKGTSHLIYALKTPIPKGDFFKNRKALFLFSLIQQEYTKLLDGDPLYVNMIAKNPLSETWQVTELNRFGAYELNELADYITLPKRILKRNAIGVGRNCYLFDAVRKWAYKEILFYKNNGATEADFRDLISDRLSKLNSFSVPLDQSELKAIAKSISTWTWRNFSQDKFDKIFSKIQTARSHKRKTVKQAKIAKWSIKMNFPKQNHKIPLSKFAEKYGISRQTAQKIAKSFGSVKPREKYEEDAKKRREIAYNLRQQGLKFREIAETLGISVNNAQQLVRRYKI